jgi:hypothetical protein
MTTFKVGDMVRKKYPSLYNLGIITNISQSSSVITVAIIDRQWFARIYRTTAHSLELVSPS